jgi:pimeloyl-ACP methyl ester carboxylesterase
MQALTKKYEEVCRSIIRPFREEYETAALGASFFELGEKAFKRADLTLTARGGRIQCSFYHQQVPTQLPCVVYLHTSTGSRLEAMPILAVLLPSNINVFTFDCAGSGISDGEFVSLGWFEREDLGTVVSYIRQNELATCIGLWGRGMGAVTALLYADRDPCIGGMVLDSPFVSLKQLAEEEVEKRCSLPGLVKSVAQQAVRKEILRTAKFDINDLNVLEHVMRTFVPAVFCRGKSDQFVEKHHLEEIFEAYFGEKKMVEVEGHHTSHRPGFFLDSVAIFFYNALRCEEIQVAAAVVDRNEASDDSYEIL